jgi:hypothetical protein
MIRTWYLILPFAVMAMYCCKPDRSSGKKSDLYEEDTSGVAQLESRIKKVYYRFPTPDEMFTIIDSTGLQFDNTIILPVKKADQYLDSKSQSLILGVYVADLAYITLFDRYKESIDYLQVIYSLSDKIRISSAFDKNLADRIEKNIRNMDSLSSISDEALTDLTYYLVRNNKENTFAIISLGGFVEFLYLSLNLVGDYNEDNPTIQRIVDQKTAFDNIMKYSDEYSDDPNVSAILEIVQPLHEFLKNITVIKTRTTVTKGEDGRIVIEGGDKIKINKAEFNKLKQVVMETRDKMIRVTEI